MATQRVGGTVFVKVDGTQYKVKGSWTYNLGQPMREEVVGSDSVHGYTEKPQAPYISGAITDDSETDLKSLLNITGATIQMELANNKIIVLEQAFFSGEGSGTTEEGEVEVKFVGISAEEIR